MGVSLLIQGTIHSQKIGSTDPNWQKMFS